MLPLLPVDGTAAQAPGGQVKAELPEERCGNTEEIHVVRMEIVGKERRHISAKVFAASPGSMRYDCVHVVVIPIDQFRQLHI